MGNPAMRRSCLLLLLASAPLASAHPVPKDCHDRIVIVRPTPTALVIEYRLEVDGFRAAVDFDDARAGGAAPKPEKGVDFPTLYLRAMTPYVTNNLLAWLDGRELDFTCTASAVSVTDSIRCDYRLEAPWTLKTGGRHVFSFKENAFERDARSQINVILAVSPLLKAEDMRSSDIRKASCVLLVTPDSLPGVARPALPPDTGRRPKAIFPSGFRKPLSGAPNTAGRGGPPPPADDVAPEPPEKTKLLHLLFDTKRGLAILLLLAALFGAAHALTPGHGKTMVAAYLIGERGTAWHALVLGIVTTLTHTSSVIALALLLLLVPGTDREAVQAALGLVGGLLIACTGLWLLMRRLANRADHVHLDTGPPTDKPGWWQLILLGISGGLVPCWDAIILLGVAISAHKLWLGVPLLLAFSAGLAAVLVAVGVAVVKARDLLGGKKEGGPEVSLGRWDLFLERAGAVLPVVSALFIIGIGLWLCFESASMK